MPNYRYRARDKFGVVFSGTLETNGKEAVASQLDSLGYFPVSIQEERPSFRRLDLSGVLTRFQPIRAEEMIVLSRQLATLISAGIPFLASFDALAEQTENPRLREIILKVRRDIEGGSSFSDALAKYPLVFSPLYVSMVRAGEAGGVLDEILDRLASLAEHEAETRARIKSATRYPFIVIATLIVAIAILVTWVIPKFALLYSNFKVVLPLPTRVLIGVNAVVHQFGLLILLLFVFLIFGMRRYIRTDAGRLLLDRIKLRLPVFGPILLKVALSRFARVFGTLSRSGLPVLQTLEIVSNTVGNVVISRVVDNIRDAAREGRGVVQPMRVSGIFPATIIQMVAIGEETGRMDEMLGKVSEYYDRQVDFSIRNLSSSLEPLLLIVIGGVILFLALAVFMPWWNMISLFKGGVG
jgi:type II secretory pathway component PulF